jgi:two-component system, OmpR family, sensor kinase
MSGSLVGQLGTASRSLFVKMFVVMLATVALVQAINFALLLVMPAPPPRVDSVARMANALAAENDGGGAYVIRHWTRLPPGPRSERDLALTRRFALALNVAATRLRVRGEGQPSDVGSAFERTVDPAARLRTGQGVRDEGDVIYGPVIVALHLPDGSWRSIRPVSGGIEPWQWRALGWLIGAMAVVVLPAWWLARRLSRPMRLFAAAAERLGRDPHAPPVPLSGPAELGESAAAFNDMQARLNRYVSDRMTMIAAVAHDLRTPLMRMSMRLPSASPDLRDALHDDIEEMNQRLIAVVALVRDMSQPARRQRVDLRSITESVVSETNDAGADAELSDGARVIVEGDPSALKAMLTNLVSNACRYAGRAEMSLTEDVEHVIVKICDRGPGLSPEDLERAFEPFFRSEDSRNRDTGGMGLGLASVRAIAHAHGGEATLIARPQGGLIARVVLPIVRT